MTTNNTCPDSICEFSDGKYKLTINNKLVQTGNRAVVVIDAKSFSITSNQIQEKVGTPEVVLIYQMAIRRRIEECISEAYKGGIHVEYQFTGGDAAILLFNTVADADGFLRILNDRHKTPNQLLFSAGATYGSVSFYTEKVPNDGDNESDSTVKRVQITDVAGFPVSLASRLQSQSQAGRVYFDGAFYDEMEKEKLTEVIEKTVKYGAATAKNTLIKGRFSFDYINDSKLISDAGSITLKTGTGFALEDWSSLWKLLMGGNIFLTMNQLKSDNWLINPEPSEKENVVENIKPERRVQVGLMGLINRIYPAFSVNNVREVFPDFDKTIGENKYQPKLDDIQRCCRLFIYENDKDASDLAAVFKLHNDMKVGCRKISAEKYKAEFEEERFVFPGAFSISQIDGQWFIANYEYDTERKISFINIPKLTNEQISNYLNVYFQIYLKADIIE